MKIVVTGATGNVGTSVIGALAGDARVTEIVGVARRLPQQSFPKTRFVAADVARETLVPLFEGAHAVVHLAWRIQSAHDEAELERTNVRGSQRVFEAAVQARVPALVHASSVGVYSPGSKDLFVDERHPREGIRSSLYSRQKARVEHLLDALEAEQPQLRIVRLRPGLIFKREAATGIQRLFIGSLAPRFLLAPERIPWVPEHPMLRVQAVHGSDVGEAYRLAVMSEARGAFNIASSPVLDGPTVAAALGVRTVRTNPTLLRSAAAVSFRLRLQPTDPGWVDLACRCPLLDCSRAERELGWKPQVTSLDALFELLRGMHEGAGLETPPLAPPGRISEMTRGRASGVA